VIACWSDGHPVGFIGGQNLVVLKEDPLNFQWCGLRLHFFHIEDSKSVGVGGVFANPYTIARSDETASGTISPGRSRDLWEKKGQVSQYRIRRRFEFRKIDARAAHQEIIALNDEILVNCFQMSERLPIYDIESGIVTALRSTRRLVLQAPTGSGKSTQVPQILLNHDLLGGGQAVILQPRRLAARLLASRVAQELGVELGREVGYQVRFENVSTASTRIKFETEGILLRQMVHDPGLKGVGALIFDEFHERHLYGDITLARALDIQEQSRPDLLLIVMSATLDAGALEKYMAPVAFISSAGRTFPVSVDYLPKRIGTNGPPIWDLAADAFSANGPDGGDVLIFMPGGYEIQRTLEALRQRPQSKGYLLLPLHGELPPKDQDAAVARYDRPKVVVTTNVAETSITIDGVRLVIDSGLARISRYDPNRGINTLLVERISQASAEQRAGRAGRTEPGRCIRLWSQPEHGERPTRELPEVKRLDLSEVVLTLKASGVEDLPGFRWLEAPGDAALNHAEQLLLDLGALEQISKPHTAITDLGRSMLAFPVHPRYARMLIAADAFDCVYQACLVAALTQGRDVLLRNPSKEVAAARDDFFGTADKTATSDVLVLLRAWDHAWRHQFRMEDMRGVGIHAVAARQAAPLFEQFLRIARQEGLAAEPKQIDEEALRKCILMGFSDRVARRTDEGQSRFQLVHGRRGMLSRESVVRASPLIVVTEIQEIGGKPGDVNTVLSFATAIEIEWLRELFPKDLHEEIRVAFDTVSMKVRADEVLLFRDLAVRSRRVDQAPPDAAARLLAEEILAGRLHLPKWDHGVEQWILRLNRLSAWRPELGLPTIGTEERRHIIEQLCHGAAGYKDLKDREVKSVVKSWLSSGQHSVLDREAPERAALSNGRTPKITYEAEGPPFIALRIQELFGVAKTPCIAEGRVPLSVHILAPSMRPVQVTQDLTSFWKEHYPRIKSELQRKYPKHEWR
jgi:ATP-dependent helicase HrpB